MFYAYPSKYSIDLRRQHKAGRPNCQNVPYVRMAIRGQIMKADAYQGCWAWMAEFDARGAK